MAAKIILVEPDEEQRQQFLNAIKGSPFEVHDICNTNAEAMELYDTVRPHLVVMRLVSGKLGATAALDRLRKKDHKARVVVSYDVRSTHLLMAAYAHGAVSAIKQPFARHRVVEKLTFAIASERHEKLAAPIVRLEHPFEVRYKRGGWLARSRCGFCERLGLSDMDLNTEKPLRVNQRLRLDLLLPPPTGTLHFVGVVEAVEMTRPDNARAYIALKNVSPEERKIIEAFVVRAARRV